MFSIMLTGTLVCSCILMGYLSTGWVSHPVPILKQDASVHSQDDNSCFWINRVEVLCGHFEDASWNFSMYGEPYPSSNFYFSFFYWTAMQAFLDLGELLISSDGGAALDCLKTVWISCYSVLNSKNDHPYIKWSPFSPSLLESSNFLWRFIKLSIITSGT